MGCISTYVNAVYEWEYYTCKLLSSIGIFERTKGNTICKLYHPTKSGSHSNPTGRTARNGYVSLTNKVKDFVGTYKPEHYLLNSKEPISMGPLDLQGYLFEHKAQQSQAMKNAKKVILEVAEEFEKLTGRKYGLFEEYKLEDADVAIVCMNSTAGTAKFVVDDLRSKGVKAGLLKVRVFRPFPAEEIAKALANVKAVAVLDKADSLNAAGGALFTDVTSGMYVNNIHVPTVSYIYGIGGRDTKSDDIEKVYNDLLEIVETGKIDNPYRHLGLRTKGAEK